MARQNTVMLYGLVAESPLIGKNPDGTEFAAVHVIVARGKRYVGDGSGKMKCDNPFIMTREEKMVEEIRQWKKNDIVHIKGVISTKTIKKVSHCAHCGAENRFIGALLYINPIFAERQGRVENHDEGLSYLYAHMEVSNQAYVIGTLCRDPGKVKSKYDYKIIQYQIAIGRKYRIRTDPPEVRIDYPWVKSYGENAEEDFKRLKIGAEVFIDGFLQARSVRRYSYCGQDSDEKGHPKKNEDGSPVFKKDAGGKPVGCGQQYEWKDRVMELVPYETEYLTGYLTDEDLKTAGDIHREEDDDSQE